MTIKHLFPVSKPTLDLNFAATRALDPRITFTRSSTGTYVDSRGILQTAAEDEPRFDHDPETGESLGLLIEVNRTNHCLHSDIDSTNWSQNGTASLAVSSVPAPDGGTCYDLTTDNDGPNSVRQNNTSAPVGTSVISVFARFPNAGFTALNIRDYSVSGGANFYADYIPATDSWSGESNCVGLPSEDLGNGWKRLTVVSTATSRDGTNEIRIGGGINSSAFTQQTCQIWGVQVEAGEFPTSYIPTTGSVESRSVDIASITGTNNFSSWYHQSEGTMFVDMSNSSEGWMGANLYSSGSDRIIIMGASNNGLRYQAVGSGNTADFESADNVRDGEPIKYAYAYKPNEYAFCVRGDLKTNTANPQPVVNKMKIGEEPTFSGNRRCNCPIARIAYYPTRLPDEQLKALTH